VTNENDRDTQIKNGYVIIFDPGSGSYIDFTGFGPWSGSTNQTLTFNVAITV
jgi:hypothetical protein